MNRQRLILFILVILFVAAGIWSYSAIPRPKTISSPTHDAVRKSKPVAAVKKTENTVDDTKLHIDRLNTAPSGFKGYKRNIFKPFLVDEVKIAKQKAVATKPPPQLPQVPTVPVIVPPPKPPLARFTFLGFLHTKSAKTVFLAKESEILLVKKGDMIAGRYQATSITDQSLTLSVTDTGETIVIPLSENR
ncbi:MAG: type II secretion system protein PulP [Desulfuromonadaceae bacterium]|nr:type II secretion system protein PulP [Desulfuromonadaceae bacterium]MDD5106160.1 type II secretion system protein PulP [Desulfuromonadaceae bacterium]